MGEDHLRLLGEMLDLLDRYAASVSRDDLEQDTEAWLKVKGAMELAVQCSIDLALALLSQRALGVPETYREAFTLLTRAGLIEPDLATQMGDWAGLRNILVHIYTSLDLDRLHEALRKTEPLKQFRAIAARLLIDTDSTIT